MDKWMSIHQHIHYWSSIMSQELIRLHVMESQLLYLNQKGILLFPLNVKSRGGTPCSCDGSSMNSSIRCKLLQLFSCWLYNGCMATVNHILILGRRTLKKKETRRRRRRQLRHQEFSLAIQSKICLHLISQNCVIELNLAARSLENIVQLCRAHNYIGKNIMFLLVRKQVRPGIGQTTCNICPFYLEVEKKRILSIFIS